MLEFQGKNQNISRKAAVTHLFVASQTQNIAIKKMRMDTTEKIKIGNVNC